MSIFQQIQAVWAFSESAQAFVELFLKANLAHPQRLTGWSLDDRDPRIIQKLLPFFGGVYRYYFRVTTDGWEYVPKQGKVLLVGSHNGGLAAPDTVMMTYHWFQQFGTERLAYALMEPKMWQVFPGVARLATQVGCIQADSRMAIAALRRNAAVLIYPGGVRDVFRPHALEQQIYFQGNHGFIKLALLEEVPIVPVISHGAHSTLWVLADIYPQLAQLHQWGVPWPFNFDPGTFPIYLGLPWGLAIGPWPNIPLPVPIHIRICPPIRFDRYGAAAAHDPEYLQACYDQVCQTMQRELDRLFAENP